MEENRIEEENKPEEAAEEQPMPESVEVIGVQFRVSGKVYYFAPGDVQYAANTYAVVETARGQEYGRVAMANTVVPGSEVVPPLRKALRPATENDTRRHEENARKEQEAFAICAEQIARHGLEMKLLDAEYTFDNSKLLFYFSAEGRVDFRELVKDLASIFRTRIDLRQVGIRDETKMIGGLGVCGRPFCCSTFLPDFAHVTIKMAKEQNLSLNSTKISGGCGRLMCCLRFEHETYEEAVRQMPRNGSAVKTPDGEGTVVETQPLARLVRVRMADDPTKIRCWALEELGDKPAARRVPADPEKIWEGKPQGEQKKQNPQKSAPAEEQKGPQNERKKARLPRRHRGKQRGSQQDKKTQEK